MEFQKTDCFGSHLPGLLVVLVVALVVTALVLRLWHQGILVHSAYWLVGSLLQGGDLLLVNAVGAGLLHLVSFGACLVWLWHHPSPGLRVISIRGRNRMAPGLGEGSGSLSSFATLSA